MQNNVPFIQTLPMKLIAFLFRTKILNLKRRYKSAFLLSVHICLFFIALSYVAIYSGILNYLANHHQLNNIAFFLGIFNYIFFGLPIALLFIPFYKPKIIFFQKMAPAKFRERTIFEIANQLFSSFFLLQVMIVAILFFCAKPVSLWQAAIWIQLLIASSIVRLIIQSVINFKTSIQTQAALIIVIILVTECIVSMHLALLIATFILTAIAIAFYHLLQFIYKQ